MFKNRIVGFGFKPADQFTANPDNFRVHPEQQQRVVRGLLSEIGWAGVVVENAVTGLVIDGHERIWEALEDGSEVPYIQVDLTPEEEKLLITAFDASSRMAGIDRAKASTIIAELRTTATQMQIPIIEAVVVEYALQEVAAPFVPGSPAAAPERKVACPECGHVFNPDDL